MLYTEHRFLEGAAPREQQKKKEQTKRFYGGVHK